MPHLAARMVSGRAELAEICDRLREAGVSTVFVPGGDADPPAGDYTSALDLLEDLTALGSPFAEVGITGYPESHPTISDDLTVQAMWDKRRHATHVVSNLSFDPETIRVWLDRVRGRGVTMPMLLGIPGPIDRAKLLSMATRIGVGDSTRFLAKHKGTFARLAAPGGFTGERFLEQCAPVLARPEALVTGLHVYTFNQVAETEAWRRLLPRPADGGDLRGRPAVAGRRRRAAVRSQPGRTSARARSRPVCPVGTTVSGRPMRSAARSASTRSSSSGCWASQTIRV